jgi:type III secretion system (T3SS) SseB-like protein
VPELITGGQGDPADRGDADSGAAAALRAFASGQGSEHAALSALASARLLIPVVAVLAEPAAPDEQAGPYGRTVAPGPAPQPGSAPPGPGPRPGSAPPGLPGPRPGSALRREKVSEMALPTLIGHDGRPAVLAFTGLAALLAWRPDARPVPVPAGPVWRAAAGIADAVVIDVAGPVPLAVDGARLAALAAGRPVPPPEEDPDVLAAVAAAVAGEPAIAGFGLRAGDDGTDLTVELALAAGHQPGGARAQEAAGRAASRIMAAAGDRLRRGIAVAISAGGVPGRPVSSV